MSQLSARPLTIVKKDDRQRKTAILSREEAERQYYDARRRSLIAELRALDPLLGIVTTITAERLD